MVPSSSLHSCGRGAAVPGDVEENLARLLDRQMLVGAFHKLRRRASPGIDGVTHGEYAENLDENLLAVHVNYLWRDDAAVLGRYNASVVHCPRSHAYFKHLLFPRAELAAAVPARRCGGGDGRAEGKAQLPDHRR